MLKKSTSNLVLFAELIVAVPLTTFVNPIMGMTVRRGVAGEIHIDGIVGYLDSSFAISSGISKLTHSGIKDVIFQRLLSLFARFVRAIPVISHDFFLSAQ